MIRNDIGSKMHIAEYKKNNLTRILNSVRKISNIENLPTEDRYLWQLKAIDKVVSFSRTRSAFWRERTKNYICGDISTFTNIPILNRFDVRRQIEEEKSLVNPIQDNVPVFLHQTGGSSGNSLTFFVTANNSSFNDLRGFAQSVIESRDISRDRMNSIIEKGNFGDIGFKVINQSNWGGHFQNFLTGKSIIFKMYSNFDSNKYIENLNGTGINGYFSSNPRSSRAIAGALASGAINLSNLNMYCFVNRGDKINPIIKTCLKECNIPLKSTYSCEEIGPIGFSCPLNSDLYHVASTNVMVEGEEMLGIDAQRLIVTGLNSFATPFIRYDIGDVGQIKEGCDCGWRGQVISNLQGRRTRAVRLIDGSLRFCLLEATDFADLHLEDMRIRQYEYGKLDVEYVRTRNLSPKEKREVYSRIYESISADIDVNIDKLDQIHWGSAYKRHFFRCEI